MEKDTLRAMRHSLAHIMAAAVLRLWPAAKLGVGPVVEHGFYYDIDVPDTTISEADFAKIEKEMKKIIKQNQPFEYAEQPIDEAIQWAEDSEQPYKLELLNDLKREGTTKAKELNEAMMGLAPLPAGIGGVERAEVKSVVNVSFYTNDEFTDLCRGPHVASTGKVGAFKLMRIAGAYWRSKEDNPQMQRLYGVAFATKTELQQHLHLLEEAKKRDHRKLGKELDLFVVSDMVGAGLPLFTPRGTVLREKLTAFSNELRENLGFKKVWIPHITKEDLYKTSGHWAKFGDELFLVKSQETSDNFVMKPMNCPHHTQIYAARPRSYRDLPLRYLETTTVYRDEKTGELGGLSRVRAITQDDSHAFCRPDQIKPEISQLLAAATEMYETFAMKLRVRLSYCDDSEAYLGDKKLWESAQTQLKEAVEANNMDFFEEEGEAAFYGPKIDFMATDALGREHQVATVQLDFVQPERFGLEYADEQGGKQAPVMVHSALLGSVERFLAVYIEHTGGRFPIWLAPEQIRVIQVNDDESTTKFVAEIVEKSKEQGLRVVVDSSNESVGKKIRAAELYKIPYSIVVGDKEVDSGQLSPRIRTDLAVEIPGERSYLVENFLRSVANESKDRASKSSL